MSRTEELLQQIRQLEEKLRVELNQRSQVIGFKIKGKKVTFERSIKLEHKRRKLGAWRWLFGVRPLNLITAPIIYTMVIPLLMVDLLVSFYQYTCFPIYGIHTVKRGDYIVFDRHRLNFLNMFERLHCLYCAYGNGVVAYIREVLARTEQYFCPIKHAHKVLGTHDRYYQFIEYGDANDYHQRVENYREKLAKEE
ncbi:hypothetical protein [Methylophaga sp.]|uniref:hypothetical protein n=1 Tax=Methylophaga sp. TaxID=2024840 RepID=UPI003F69C059